jgi:hypothetical protein
MPSPTSAMPGDAARAERIEHRFESWLMGGFESSTIRFWDGRRIDMIVKTGHDLRCAEDYALLRRLGIGSVRDSLRWHLIESGPGRYDWSSWTPMLAAAERARMQVIWDICHFGMPDHVDPFAADFPERFADFAEAAARWLRAHSDAAPWWCPINEISYWSFAAGEDAFVAPAAPGRAEEFKRQLVRAALAAIERLRRVDPRAGIIAVDPLVHVVPEDGSDPGGSFPDRCFAAWDMLLGLREPELGGHGDAIDVIGVNYYAHNQWTWPGRRELRIGDAGFRPLRLLLRDVWQRYERPILISETGAEEPIAARWLRYATAESLRAIDDGVPLVGMCLYPVMDYPGWTDDRHCPCGPVGLTPDGARYLRSRVAHCVRSVVSDEKLRRYANDDDVPDDVSRMGNRQ